RGRTVGGSGARRSLCQCEDHAGQVEQRCRRSAEWPHDVAPQAGEQVSRAEFEDYGMGSSRRQMRTGLVMTVLTLAGGGLWYGSAGRPQVDAGDLAREPERYLGSEVVVIGEWVHSRPYSREGYMVVELRALNGDRVACHLEHVPGANRNVL